MTLAINIAPEMEARLQQEAAKCGHALNIYVQNALLLAWGLRPARDEAESAFVAEWIAASQRTLQEYWDNDEDAVYDTL